MTPKPRRALDLFTGTQSIAKWCRAHGFDEVVTLDIDPKANADHTCNIMDFDYKQYPRFYFEYVHASVPCTEYSIAKTTKPRDIEGANRIVLKTLEIIQWLAPTVYTIENPATGLLRKQTFMAMLPYTITDYCTFSTPEQPFHYRKRTIWFTNRVATLVKPHPLCNGACAGIREPVPGAPEGRRTHAVSFGGQPGGKRFMLKSNVSINQKHAILQSLLSWLLLD